MIDNAKRPPLARPELMCTKFFNFGNDSLKRGGGGRDPHSRVPVSVALLRTCAPWPTRGPTAARVYDATCAYGLCYMTYM